MLLAAGGEHQHGGARSLWRRPQRPTDVGPGHVRQHQVEDDQVRRLLSRRGQRLPARAGHPRPVAGALHVERQGGGDVGLVLDDEDQPGHEPAIPQESRASAAAMRPAAVAICSSDVAKESRR